MSRLQRCEFQGAIYLVTLAGCGDENVFYDPRIFNLHLEKSRGHAPAANFFEKLLWDMCVQYGARVHAYVLEPNAALVIIQTLGAPLGWIMHDLLAQCSVYLRGQRRKPQSSKPFPGRYKAQIVQPAKLPYAVRYVQRRVIAGDRHRRAINHPFSSHLIYCGRRSQPDCFVVSATLSALAQLGYLGPNSYFEFMSATDSPSISHMLSLRVIGECSFVEAVRRRCKEPRRTPSPDDILREVTDTLLHMEPAIACSSSHRGALARALVAWYAMRTGAAQIGAVARWFGVTSSDLRYLIQRHRQRHPHYFSMPLSELFPTADTRARSAPLGTHSAP